MSETIRFILGGILLIALIGLFIFTYLLNKRTPKPKGCENIDENCEGCPITSCGNRIENKMEE